MEQPTPTTSSTDASSPTTNVNEQQPPPPPAAAPPPPQPQPQPQPATPMASSPQTPNPNPNSNPSSTPSASTVTPNPQPHSTPARPHHPSFPGPPWPHPPFSHSTASISTSASASPPVSASQPRAAATTGGIAIGVPAPAHASPSPTPSFPSSSFGQPQFGALARGGPVGLPEAVPVPAASTSQVRPGMQGIRMPGPMNSSSQLRAGGVPSPHHPAPVQQSLRPPPSSSNNQYPTAQNFQGIGLMRPSPGGPSSSSSAPVSTSKSVQSPHQPWMSAPSQMKPPFPSPSYRPQMTSPSLPAPRSITAQLQQQSLLSTSQQNQHVPSSQLPQLLPPHQPPEHQGQQFPPSKFPHSSPQPQQVTKVQASGNQKQASPVTIQPNSVQPVMQNKTSNIESDEFSSRILSKRTIHELVSQVDPLERLDPEVEDILADIADDFVESITTFGCSLAKHRKSDRLEAKDILLHLERNWNITLPGFSGDEIKTYRKPIVSDIHKERLAVIKKSALVSDMANTKNTVGQVVGSAKGNPTRTPASAMFSPNLKVREVT